MSVRLEVDEDGCRLTLIIDHELNTPHAVSSCDGCESTSVLHGCNGRGQGALSRRDDPHAGSRPRLHAVRALYTPPRQREGTPTLALGRILGRFPVVRLLGCGGRCAGFLLAATTFPPAP